MEIRRDYYLNKLISRKGNGLIKVITGVRRCGKSYLLNTLFYRHLLTCGVPENHIIQFAFDSADDLHQIGESLIDLQKQRRKVDPEKFMAFIRSGMTDKDMYYLLLDEVQMMDSFEAVLNGYLRKDNIDVLLAECALHRIRGCTIRAHTDCINPYSEALGHLGGCHGRNFTTSV